MLLTVIDAYNDLSQVRDLRERAYQEPGDAVVDVTVEVHAIVWTGIEGLPMLATLGEGAWLDDQAARAREERLFVAIPSFLASGTHAG